MRIAWITPISRGSAIARMAVPAATHLADRGHHVDIIRAETGKELEGQVYTTHLKVLTPEQLNFSVPNAGYDLAVAHLGDYYLFHAAFFDLADRIPCLGVFHDFYLYDLFAGWLQARDATPAAQEDEVVSTYGPSTVDIARRARSGAATLEEIAREIPMTEWAARRCAGALAHSSYYLDRLSGACAGPTAMAHLPWEGRGIAPLGSKSGMKTTAVTLGVMNANKCADAVIAAICASAVLKERMRYTLVGQIQPAEKARLERLAREGGFDELAILGAVDDPTLIAELEAADIVCCLRKPVLEGASASAIEGMLSGRPTIVANAGFYGELPNELVFKVGAGIEITELTATLERLVLDERLRSTVGNQARAWAKEHFSISRYIDTLDALIQATMNAQPMLDLGHAIGAELHAFGLKPDDPSVGRIAETLEAILSSS